MPRTSQPPARRVVALVCILFALLALLASSVKMATFLLSFGQSITGPGPEDAIGAAVCWPLLMGLVVVLGSLGLRAAQRARAIGGLVAAGIVGAIIPINLALNAGTAIGQQLPAIGPAPRRLNAAYSRGSALAIVAFFVLLNGAALVSGWRVLRRRGPHAAP